MMTTLLLFLCVFLNLYIFLFFPLLLSCGAGGGDQHALADVQLRDVHLLGAVRIQGEAVGKWQFGH